MRSCLQPRAAHHEPGVRRRAGRAARARPRAWPRARARRRRRRPPPPTPRPPAARPPRAPPGRSARRRRRGRAPGRARRPRSRRRRAPRRVGHGVGDRELGDRRRRAGARRPTTARRRSARRGGARPRCPARSRAASSGRGAAERPVLGERGELVVLLVALDDVAVAVDDDVAQHRGDAHDDAVLGVVLAVDEAEVLDLRAAADLAHVVPALAVEVVEPAHPLGQQVGAEVARERLAVAGGPGGDDLVVQRGRLGADGVGGEVRVVGRRLGGGELDARDALAPALAQRGGLEEPEAEQREADPSANTKTHGLPAAGAGARRRPRSRRRLPRRRRRRSRSEPPPGAAIESTASSRPTRTVIQRPENRRRVTRRRTTGLSRLLHGDLHTGRSRNRRSEPNPIRRPSRAAPADQVLALQRQIGNRAVGALLARAPTPKTPAKSRRRRCRSCKDGI